jgi:crotonobetainyl-CoA:carnitine CoA-transferase CaiB-like acyl-CoA transferase
MRLAWAVMGVGNSDGFAAVTVGTALLLGLLARARGAGAHSMLTTMLSTSVHALSEDMVRYEGRAPLVTADAELHGLSALYRLYETADGWIFMAAPTDREWRRLAAALEPYCNLADDERFATEGGRQEHADELAATLEGVFLKRPAVQWERDLRAADVACSEVAPGPVEANFMDEGSVGRACGFVTETTHPVLDEVPRLVPLVAFSRSTTVARGAGLVGQQTDSVLGELGYDSARIESLRAAGVIGG